MSQTQDAPSSPAEPAAVAPVKHTNAIYPKRDEHGELVDDPTPVAEPPAPAEPAPDPPAEPGPASDPVPPGDDIPDDVRQRVLDELRVGVPATPEDYVIPDIEGFDKETAADSAIFKTMRSAAHEAGLKPEAFDKLVQDYVTAEVAETNEFHSKQMALLGKDETAQQARVGQVNAALTRMLPKELAEGLMHVAATAAAVQAIEALINRAPSAAPSAPPAPKDDADTIRKLMNSKEYMGYEHERDPAIVARVDRFFEAGGTIKG